MDSCQSWRSEWNLALFGSPFHCLQGHHCLSTTLWGLINPAQKWFSERCLKQRTERTHEGDGSSCALIKWPHHLDHYTLNLRVDWTHSPFLKTRNHLLLSYCPPSLEWAQKPLRFRMVSLAVWVFWLFFFLHISGPTIHTICQGALNVVSKFWLCGGDMQPDDASAIGFILVWGPSLWLGASRTLSGILVHRSVMRETGLWRWKDFAEIQIQPFHSSDVDPEFQGQERNSSRWHCDLVVGA